MSRSLLYTVAMIVAASPLASAQVGSPGIEYSGAIATGEGGQLYPYDQQDPWLHGQYQRVPAYGGFASFRPYNYRHVFAQTQIATGWGAAHGMPYSQQFWNRYRGSYLQGNLHSQLAPSSPVPQSVPTTIHPIYRTSFDTSGSSGLSSDAPVPNAPASNHAQSRMSDGRPVHIFPDGAVRR